MDINLKVIKDSLIVDYSKVKIDYDQKFKLLKMERIRLLQEKIKEKTGKDVKINLLGNLFFNFFYYKKIYISKNIFNIF